MAHRHDDNPDPWSVTILRTQGLRLIRPDLKSWRPIITVEVDKHHSHETILGIDGQNPNLKEAFYLHEAGPSSQVKIGVWHCAQSKKKKKRKLVATAIHSLGELAKKQAEGHKAEVRLTCHSPNKTCTSSPRGGRSQNGAAILLRIRVPPLSAPRITTPEPLETVGYSSDSDSSTSDTLSIASSPAGNDRSVVPIDQPGIRRRKRVRGYVVDSDDDVHSDDEPESVEMNVNTKSSHHDEPALYRYDSDGSDESSTMIIHISGNGDEGMGWVAPSLLPQNVEKLEPPPPLTRTERALASFTMYSELKEANFDSHYEAVFGRLQMEWTYTGGLLVALAAVDTAVFSISPDSAFTVGSYARSAIAGSSIASGLGIACDAWFLLRYNWADLNTFKTRARDVFGSYFFFSLSARVPAICLFLSAVSLMSFLGLVAFEAWPSGVLVVSFFIGVIMSMQFLVFGAHWCATKVAEGGRAGRKGVVSVVRKVRGE